MPQKIFGPHCTDPHSKSGSMADEMYASFGYMGIFCAFLERIKSCLGDKLELTDLPRHFATSETKLILQHVLNEFKLVEEMYDKIPRHSASVGGFDFVNVKRQMGQLQTAIAAIAVIKR